MAAMDFPSSPTNGQVYGNYVYSTAKGAWQASPTPQSVAVSSPTAPSNPKNDTLWYNTQDGNTYIYFNDGNTSQWVQLKSDATLSSTLGNRVTTLETYPAGLVPVIPTSITVGSGTGSVAVDGTITFSNSSTLSVDGVFTSAFRNYRIVMTRMVANTASALQGRFRAGGSTLSSNVYYTAAAYQRADAVAGTYSGFNGIGYTELSPITVENGWTAITWDVFQPAISDTHTTSFFQGTGYSTSVQNRNGSVMYNGQAALDGFHINSNVATNISGVIKIYGYR